MKTVEELVSLLWYNNHIWAATYGHCHECKVESARGGGLCVPCTVKQLGEQVGDHLAIAFSDSIKTCKNLEKEIYDTKEDR